MKTDSVWTCKVCDRMGMALYDGPKSPEAIADWAQVQHDRVSPDCPYRFRQIQFLRMSSDNKAGNR